MKTEIICAIISTGGVVLSALGSLVAAKFAATKEIKKLKIELEHGDNAALSAKLSDALAAVAKYSGYPCTMHQAAAKSQIAEVRGRYSGETGRLLDELYADIAGGNSHAVDKTLALLVAEMRKREADHGVHG